MRKAMILLVFLTVLASAKSKRSYLFTSISDTEGAIISQTGNCAASPRARPDHDFPRTACRQTQWESISPSQMISS
jgi:hypothetical protein